jgi:MFS family permease
VWGAKPLFVTGVLVQAAGILLLAAPSAMAQATGRALAFAAMGFGASLCTSTAQSAAFLDVPPHRMGEASALWNINRQLSFCLGAAVLGSALNLLLSTADANAVSLAYRGCFLFAATLTLLPLPLLARLRGGHAAAPSVSYEPSDPP